MKSLWSDHDARGLDGLDALVYTSRLIGASPNLVLWGGGNSSVKAAGKDHAGRATRILYIKGSGSDMKTITAQQFTPLRLDDLLPLINVPNSQEVIRKIYGDAIVVVPYFRPGFLLSKRTGEAVRQSPHARAVILDKHGLITWGETARAAYLDTVKYVTMAERHIASRQPRRLR